MKIIRSERFDSKRKPWPTEIKPWPGCCPDGKGNIMADGSQGYIKNPTMGTYRPVKSGDLVVTYDNGFVDIVAAGTETHLEEEAV